MEENLIDKVDRICEELILLTPCLSDALEKDSAGSSGGGGSRPSKSPVAPVPFNMDVLSTMEDLQRTVPALYHRARTELGESVQPRDFNSMTYSFPGLLTRLVHSFKIEAAIEIADELNRLHRRLRKVLGLSSKNYPLHSKCFVCEEGFLYVASKELPRLNLYRDREGNLHKLPGAYETIAWDTNPPRAYCSNCEFEASMDSFEWLADKIRSA